MQTNLTLGGITIHVVQKDIKNVHLSVHPPEGRVTIAAPLRMNADTIRVFAISKLDWIKQHQAKLRAQPREEPREYLERESHYVWGRRCLLQIVEHDAPPAVDWSHRRLTLTVRRGTDEARRREILDAWYRSQLRQQAKLVTAEWERRLGVRVQRIFVQRMKTKWGSCNPSTGAVRLNTELAKKPRECLEYIVVHELVHLLEPTHNARFIALMDGFLPGWPHRRDQLNRLPVPSANWTY